MLVPFYDNNKSLEYTYKNNPYQWVDLSFYLNIINDKVIDEFWKLDAFNLPKECPEYKKLCEKYPPVNLKWDNFISFETFLTSAKLFFNTWFECKYWLRTKWTWEHPWIDLAMPEWTPIESFTDWEVFFAKENWEWWNLVIIRNKDKYFCYAHLNKINVKKWDSIKKWEILWECWKTGNASWYHLHFQIDKENSPFHPYRPKTESPEKYCIDPWNWLRENYQENKKEIKNNEDNLVDSLINNLSKSTQKSENNSNKIQLTKAENKTQNNDLVSKLLNELPKNNNINYIEAFQRAWVIKWDNWNLLLNKPLTRYQFTLILYRLVKAWLLKLENKKCNTHFEDIQNLDDEFYKALDLVCWNWILHWEWNKFMPWQKVSWIQFLAVIWRLFWNLKDWEWEDWFKPYENWAIKKWLISTKWKYLFKVLPRKEMFNVLWELIFKWKIIW